MFLPSRDEGRSRGRELLRVQGLVCCDWGGTTGAEMQMSHFMNDEAALSLTGLTPDSKPLKIKVNFKSTHKAECPLHERYLVGPRQCGHNEECVK